MLKKLLKGLTAKHVEKKADFFTADEMGNLINDILKDEEPKTLGMNICIIIQYYGLLRRSEARTI